MNHYVKTTKPALWTTTPSGRRQVAKEVERATQRKKTRQIKRSAQRTPIRKRSKSLTKRMKDYLNQKAVFLAKHPYCMVHGKPHLATQIHHSRGRVGTLLLDERFWFAVGQSGHAFIHEEPAAARAMGYLCKTGDWNRPVPLNINPLSDESVEFLPH